MTLDEAISDFKERAENSKKISELGMKSYIPKAKEEEQLAEWLEELKAYREIGTVEECRNSVLNIPKAYNKAIDDFVKFANTMPTVETDDGEIRPMWLEEMAEQLKAGGNIELSEYSKSKGNRTGK